RQTGAAAGALVAAEAAARRLPLKRQNGVSLLTRAESRVYPRTRRQCDLTVLPDPLPHVLLQEIHRESPVPQHFVVERADVEPRAEGGGRRVAQLAELQLADLVGERLAGIHDVAVHLDDDVLLRLGGVVLE